MKQRFLLVRHFTAAGVGLFAVVAIALAYFEREQALFIHAIQREEIALVAAMQDGIAQQQQAMARQDLLTAQERANTELTRLFANVLWERNFAPLVAQAGELPVEPCRAIPDAPGDDGQPAAPPAKKECFARLGERLRALPAYQGLDAQVVATMRGSSVFKIKVFDLRGVTVYSSEPSQVGEDKSRNAGWRGAVGGTPRSELTHRDRFSSFEGVVENRDLISSYLPVHAPRGGAIVGVFEVYSDVTPLLAHLRRSSAAITQAAQANQQRLGEVWTRNLSIVDAMSWRGPAIVIGLLLLLFAALWGVVRRAGAIIALQEGQREQAAESLRRENTALAENARLREDVERMSRHDLKTPLNSVIGVARLLHEDAAVRPDHRELAAIAERAGMRMLEMVNLSLDLSRMEQGNYDFRPAAVDLAETARRVLEDLRSLAGAARVRVELVPAAGGPLYARAEELLCYSIFANLVKNAIEASPPGAMVRIVLERGDPLRVRVHNAGTVPPEVAARFFQKYVTAGKAGGTGLGTYSARLMARVQGGELEMRTGEEGTELTLTLPALGAEPAAAPAARACPLGPVDVALLPPRRVLLVDDDEYNLLLLMRYLPSPPFELETATSGAAAIEAMARQWPHVVLLDLELPALDGVEVAQWIRARERELGLPPCRVVVMSANDDPDSRARGLAAGADRYLAKPFTRETLLATLESLQQAAGAPPLLSGPLPPRQEPPADAPVCLPPELRGDLPAFLASRRQLAEAMGAALAAGNRPELRKLAHRAAGGLALFGFAWASWQSCRICELAVKGDASELQQDIARLRSHLDCVQVE